MVNIEVIINQIHNFLGGGLNIPFFKYALPYVMHWMDPFYYAPTVTPQQAQECAERVLQHLIEAGIIK